MSFSVGIGRLAASDIAEARQWYEAQREGLGREFLDAVETTLTKIARGPARYPIAIGDGHGSLPPMIKALEQAILKVRKLPEDKQRLAAELLEEIAAVDEPYILSAEERAVLMPALERAGRGEFASDEELAALWRKCGL